MLLGLIRYFKGYILLKLSGYAPERFLNLCSSHNILVWDIEKQGVNYIMKMSISGFRKIRPLAKKTKTKITILEKRGLPFFIFKSRKRKAYFAGILICAGLLFWMSRYIWDIKIEGCEQYTSDIIMEFLENEKIVHGMKKNKIDGEKIQFLLRNAFDRITWASVSIDGTRLLIQIKENTITKDDILSNDTADNKTNEEKTEIGMDLLAPADGIITNMIVRKGTPVKKVGDYVKKGEILVSGRIEIPDDYGEILQYVYCEADGDIFIQYEKPCYIEKKREYKKRVYTGKKKHGLVLKVNNYGIHLKPFEIIPSNYDHLNVLHQIKLLDHFYLPLYWGYDVYREYKVEDSVYTEDEIKKILEIWIKEEIEDLKKKGLQIIENNVKIQIDEDRGAAAGSFLVKEKAALKNQTEVLEDSIKSIAASEN